MKAIMMTKDDNNEWSMTAWEIDYDQTMSIEDYYKEFYDIEPSEEVPTQPSGCLASLWYVLTGRISGDRTTRD